MLIYSTHFGSRAIVPRIPFDLSLASQAMDIQFRLLSKPTKDALKDAGQLELFEKCIHNCIALDR